MKIGKSDEFGQQVNYYNISAKNKCFSNLSEVVIKNGHKGFDPFGIRSFLTFRYPIGEGTMFKDYKIVGFGTEIKDGISRTYWYPRFAEEQISFEDACGKIELLLKSAVKKLIGDMKVAVPLSGGVDSSLIVGIIRKLFPDRDIYTYSAGFYGEDEFEYSRIIAKQFKTIHKEKILYADDYIGQNALLRDLVSFKGEPLHPNEIALANVEKMAKEDGCQIAMCGEGSDDIFGGYGQNLKMYMNYKNEKPFFEFFLDNYRYFTNEDAERMINEDYLVDDYQILNNALNEEEMPDDIRNKTFYFIQKIHTPGLITRGTNAMKFNGLKTGFPYMSMELVNYVNSIPFDYKVHWKSEQHRLQSNGMSYKEMSEKMDVPKYILKKIAEKYLPEKIIYRPKYGFPVPFEKWFVDLKQWPLDREIFKSQDINGICRIQNTVS
jgi:asparagine synthase (glutamine-hydrolysing)